MRGVAHDLAVWEGGVGGKGPRRLLTVDVSEWCYGSGLRQDSDEQEKAQRKAQSDRVGEVREQD